MNRDSFIFYRSFYEAIEEVDTETQVAIYNAICRKALYDEDTTLSGTAKILYTLIKPQLDANNKRYSDGQKGGRPKKETDGCKEKETSGYKNKKPNNNENENVNVNENENENVVVKSDGCADGSQQFDSCVDGIAKFYEENIGMITPYVFEILNSYRTDFSDDVIIYALKLQVEAKALNINYAKAILNSWKKKNIKTLLDAKRENEEKKLEVKKDEKIKNIYQAEDEQYQDLSKFYSN